jgi:nucleotide-binding universal stress UspA family protein
MLRNCVCEPLTQEGKMYKKILVPLDGSELAEAALPHACALLDGDGTEIVLLRVALYPMTDIVFSNPSLAPVLSEEIEDESEHYLQALASRLRGDGFNVSIAIVGGPVAESILDYADAIQADLIAMSTHGRSGVARWLLGSVADRIVHGATVPVLLVRPGRQPSASKSNAKAQRKTRASANGR